MPGGTPTDRAKLPSRCTAPPVTLRRPLRGPV